MSPQKEDGLTNKDRVSRAPCPGQNQNWGCPHPVCPLLLVRAKDSTTAALFAAQHPPPSPGRMQKEGEDRTWGAGLVQELSCRAVRCWARSPLSGAAPISARVGGSGGPGRAAAAVRGAGCPTQGKKQQLQAAVGVPGCPRAVCGAGCLSQASTERVAAPGAGFGHAWLGWSGGYSHPRFQQHPPVWELCKVWGP